MHLARSSRERSCTAASAHARGMERAWLWIGGVLLFAGVLLCCAIPASVEAIPQDSGSISLFGEVKTQVDDLTIQAQFVQADIDALDDQLEQASEAYNHLQVQLDELNVSMSAMRRDLAAAQKDRAYRLDKYEDRVCDLYKSGGSNEFLELLLSAEDGPDFLSRVRLAATQADQDRRLVEKLAESTKKMNGILAQMDEAKLREIDIRRQMSDQQVDIQAALEERKATLANLDTQISTIIEQERQRQAEEQVRLQAALQAIINGGQVYDGPLPQTDSEVLNQFLETAATYIGIPYVWAGDRPSTGMDCSGFTRFVFAQHGVDLPHFSGYQAEMGIPVDYADIQPGDLVAFGFPVHHVGIYIGDDLFIEAPRTGDVIKISQLSAHGNLAAIRRFDIQPRNGPPAIY
jgi:cell wall-associated NlpC family hydrolase/regulator of replication initiation timing